ncbi:hypothetical protein YC2023_085142 [Brassica napus]
MVLYAMTQTKTVDEKARREKKKIFQGLRMLELVKKIWRCTHGPDQRPERQMNKPDIEFLNSKIFANLWCIVCFGFRLFE